MLVAVESARTLSSVLRKPAAVVTTETTLASMSTTGTTGTTGTTTTPPTTTTTTSSSSVKGTKSTTPASSTSLALHVLGDAAFNRWGSDSVSSLDSLQTLPSHSSSAASDASSISSSSGRSNDSITTGTTNITTGATTIASTNITTDTTTDTTIETTTETTTETATETTATTAASAFHPLHIHKHDSTPLYTPTSSALNSIPFALGIPRTLPLVQCHVAARIPSQFGPGTHRLHIYSNNNDNKEHMALVFGPNILSKSLNTRRDDDTHDLRRLRGALTDPSDWDGTGCTPSLPSHIQADPPLKAEELGLRDKLMAYNLIDLGYDTLSANVALGHLPDARSYTIASAMLADLGISRIRLLTNNPHKMDELVSDGVIITERIPMVPTSWQRRHALADYDASHGGGGVDVELDDRDEYLMTKVKRMGHILDIPLSLSGSNSGDTM
ncbi:hypothetical protein BASA61_002804 [Batrachochytrium salamandrivorans]|nr:hypothetical protein BASA61_002804 [Batrachochytrium salamandrivorans]